MGDHASMPNDQDSGGGYDGGGGGGESRNRGFKYEKKAATKKLSNKSGKKETLASLARKDEEAMFNMLRNVALVIGGIFAVFAMYAFMKKDSLKAPDGYYGYDGSAI